MKKTGMVTCSLVDSLLWIDKTTYLIKMLSYKLSITLQTMDGSGEHSEQRGYYAKIMSLCRYNQMQMIAHDAPAVLFHFGKSGCYPK